MTMYFIDIWLTVGSLSTLGSIQYSKVPEALQRTSTTHEVGKEGRCSHPRWMSHGWQTVTIVFPPPGDFYNLCFFVFEESDAQFLPNMGARRLQDCFQKVYLCGWCWKGCPSPLHRVEETTKESWILYRKVRSTRLFLCSLSFGVKSSSFSSCTFSSEYHSIHLRFTSCSILLCCYGWCTYWYQWMNGR